MKSNETHIPYGLVTGIVMVIVGVAMYFTGLAFVKGMSYVAYLPFLIGAILNAMAYSKANDGYVTFGNVFGSCFKMSMIVTIVMIAWGVLSLYLLPEMKTKALEMARLEMSKQPNMTEEMMDTSLNIVKKFYNVMIISFSILGGLLSGALFSLIAAAVAPKKGERPLMDDSLL